VLPSKDWPARIASGVFFEFSLLRLEMVRHSNAPKKSRSTPASTAASGRKRAPAREAKFGWVESKGCDFTNRSVPPEEEFLRLFQFIRQAGNLAGPLIHDIRTELVHLFRELAAVFDRFGESSFAPIKPSTRQ
jgi:hypothetical protein